VRWGYNCELKRFSLVAWSKCTPGPENGQQ